MHNSCANLSFFLAAETYMIRQYPGNPFTNLICPFWEEKKGWLVSYSQWEKSPASLTFRLVRINTQLISRQCSVNRWQRVNATIKLPNQIFLCNQLFSDESVNTVLRTENPIPPPQAFKERPKPTCYHLCLPKQFSICCDLNYIKVVTKATYWTAPAA